MSTGSLVDAADGTASETTVLAGGESDVLASHAAAKGASNARTITVRWIMLRWIMLRWIMLR
jgi:hypothetical protein